MEKYQDLKKDIRRLWKLINVEIVSAVIGTPEFDRWMEKLGTTCNVRVMQNSDLLGIARKVLEM